MATRKQRRRREKEQRHEYEVVYVDSEGNELEPEEVGEDAGRPAARGAKRQQARPAARGGRVPQPPSWRRAVRRAFIFGPIMFLVIWLFESKAAPAARVAIAAFYTLAFIPLFYLTDRFAYRAYQRRLGRDAARRKS